MSMQIEQTEISDFKDFKWGEEWRALIISKEQRMNKDYYFARLVRFYGKTHDTFEYDIGDTSKEFVWIGRKKKYVGTMGPDRDPDSKTFGERISFPPKMDDIIIIDSKGNEKKQKVLAKGRTIYDFTLPVNEENTKKIKTLIGPITVNKSTTFQVVAGNEPPVAVTQESFFEQTVSNIMSNHKHQIKIEKQKKDKVNAT